MRTFLAIPITGNALAFLEHQAAHLSRSRLSSHLRLTSPDTWHLTLAFYGELTQEQLEALTTALPPLLADLSPPPTFLLPAAPFPRRSRARTLACPVEASPALRALARAARQAAAQADITLPDAPYRPHITIARIKPSAPRLGNVSRPTGRVDLPLDLAILYLSALGPDGPTHTPHASFPLDAAPPH